MKEDIFSKIKDNMNRYESILSKNATISSNAIRFRKENDTIRTEFARDVDRIVHSKAYTRYIGKTQVYSINNFDGISRRSTHVQFVSRTARTIARALGLNEDLCEAISLGHDIGHVPFGHVGEKILNDISKRELGEVFAHNVQSVRTLMCLENKGKGLNISVQVLDGILCHNGEFLSNKYIANQKTKEEFLKEYNRTYVDESSISKLRPMTLEGCIVRLSDIIAYVGKDLEDAEKLNRFSKDNLSKEIKDVVGSNNRDIMNNIILDVIYNSLGKDYISMSDKMYNILKKFKAFNYENIYTKANNKDDIDRYTCIFNKLYKVYINALENNDRKNSIYDVFLDNKCSEYIENTAKERIVIDYLSGMTDRYIINEYEKYCN